MPRRGNWSSFDLMRLRELFPRVPIDRLARLMGRSVQSVRRQAEALFRRDEPVAGEWTAAEDQQVRRSFGVLPVADLALVLGRTVGAVEQRIAWLRSVRRHGTWTREEIALVKQVYGSRPDSDLAVCLSRDPHDIAAKANELCLAKDKNVARGIRMPRWNPGSVARLRELYPTHSNLAIAQVLGRSVASVANKAHQLGLSKSPSTLRSMGRENVAARRRG